MMFITPMPPTISPTDEMATIAMATPPVMARNWSMMESAVAMPKLFGLP